MFRKRSGWRLSPPHPPQARLALVRKSQYQSSSLRTRKRALWTSRLCQLHQRRSPLSRKSSFLQYLSPSRLRPCLSTSPHPASSPLTTMTSAMLSHLKMTSREGPHAKSPCLLSLSRLSHLAKHGQDHPRQSSHSRYRRNLLTPLRKRSNLLLSSIPLQLCPISSTRMRLS